jgi:hypothetical protein
MSVGISELGLLFIGAAWFIQVFDMGGKKEVRLSRQFVLLYALGVALILVDGVMNGSVVSNLLNLLAFAGAFIVFLKFKR